MVLQALSSCNSSSFMSPTRFASIVKACVTFWRAIRTRIVLGVKISMAIIAVWALTDFTRPRLTASNRSSMATVFGSRVGMNVDLLANQKRRPCSFSLVFTIPQRPGFEVTVSVNLATNA